MQRWLRYQMGGDTPDGHGLAGLPHGQRRITLSGPRLGTGYGIGVQSRRYGETVVFGHSGGVPGYQAELYCEPTARLGVVLLRSAVFGDFEVDAVIAAAFRGQR